MKPLEMVAPRKIPDIAVRLIAGAQVRSRVMFSKTIVGQIWSSFQVAIIEKII